MGVSTSLTIASSGLAAVQYEMAVASQNVANASTPGYVEEVGAVSSRTAGGIGGGVLIGLTGRTVNDAIEASLYTQNATVSGLTTTSNAMTTISALQGSTSAAFGSSNTLSDLLGNVQTSLITLESDPASSTQQQSVLTAAKALTASINTTADTYQTLRSAAQQSIVSDVTSVNSNLALIGSLSNQIMQSRINNISSADLENQRATAMTGLSNELGVQFKEAANGDMLVSTANGLALPTRATTGPLSSNTVAITVADAYPANPELAITMGGRDVTTSLSGGTLGANITLRDQTLPTMQAELDSFSNGLASRFDAQGLTLFSDANGNLPGASTALTSPAGQVGFANAIEVNPAVTASPSLIRDGSHNVTGSATGASAFSVNTSRGDGDTTLVARLVGFALGAQVQAGVTQPAAASTALGIGGTLSSPYSSSSDLISLASTLTSAQASTIDQASSSLANETDIQTSLTAKVADVSGVSVDHEMSSIVTLQNAYAANAKVVSAVQSMFAALLAAVV